MKQVCFSLTLFLFGFVAFSQIGPPKTKVAPSKPVTLKTPVENKVLEKLPDLRITSATALATSTGPNAYTLTITCTIKNEGTAAISQDKVSVNGRFTEEANSKKDLSSTNFQSGCGSTLGLSYHSLDPGASGTLQFRCFNVVLIRSNNYVYVVLLNLGQEYKELSFSNNRLDIPIVYQ
jgi:hypothetical protein